MWILGIVLLGAVDRASIECPVDGATIEAGILLSTNSSLGHDRDLCPHAAGGIDGDEIRSGIAWCPKCGFAGTPQEIEAEIPEELGARVKKEITPKPSTPWEGWAARARILEWTGQPPARVGESWLRAAWSVRLEERPMPEGGDAIFAAHAKRSFGESPDLLLDPARSIDAALAEGKAENAPLATYVSASLWRSRGELDQAELRYQKARVDASAPLAAAIDRDLATIALEREYLGKALGRFQAALAEGSKTPEKQRALLAYLAAECARRTGAFDEATRYYKMAEKLGSGDPQLPKLVKQGLADSKVEPKTGTRPKK